MDGDEGREELERRRALARTERRWYRQPSRDGRRSSSPSFAHRRAAAALRARGRRGGSSESTVAEKWIYAERLALELRMPLLRLVDRAGGSVRLLEQQQHTRIPGYPSWPLMPLLAAVPVVGVALGSCAGLGAIKVAGSQTAFAAVDRDLVIETARLARQAGATRLALNSSLGASAQGNFYLRTKAQLESVIGRKL